MVAVNKSRPEISLNRFGHERETQQKKLYRAENVLDSVSKRLASVPEIEAYLKKNLARATIQKRFGAEINRREIVVKPGKARRRAGGCYWYITMPLWSRVEHIVLHEVAHTINIRRNGSQTEGHGWKYAAIYLDLVRFIMGADAGKLLKESFRANRVRFTEKKKRASVAATPELLERLARARAARFANLSKPA